MKAIEAWLEQEWHDYRMVVLVAVTLLGLVLLGALARVARKHGAGRVKPGLIWFGTNMALIFNAEGTWHILTVKLHQSPGFSVLVFAVFEFALMRAMALATEAYRRTTKRDESSGEITQPGHPGKAIYVVWFIALSSGVIVATNAPTTTEKLLRVVLPTIVVLLWWTALTAEGQARRRGRFAYSPQRLAVRWGLWIGDEDEDLDQARSVRRVRLIVVYGHRLETKVIGGWYHRWRLVRLAREATESEVALAVAQLDRTTTIMERVVPRLRTTDEAGSSSGGPAGTVPGGDGRRAVPVEAPADADDADQALRRLVAGALPEGPVSPAPAGAGRALRSGTRAHDKGMRAHDKGMRAHDKGMRALTDPARGEDARGDARAPQSDSALTAAEDAHDDARVPVPADAHDWIAARVRADDAPTGAEVGMRFEVHPATGRRWVRAVREGRAVTAG